MVLYEYYWVGCTNFSRTWRQVLSRKDNCVPSSDWPFFDKKFNDQLSPSVWNLDVAATFLLWNIWSGNSVSRVLNKLSSYVRLILSQCYFLLASNWKQNGWKCHNICSSQTLNSLWQLVVEFLVQKMVILNSGRNKLNVKVPSSRRIGAPYYIVRGRNQSSCFPQTILIGVESTLCDQRMNAWHELHTACNYTQSSLENMICMNETSCRDSSLSVMVINSRFDVAAGFVHCTY